MNVIGQDTIGQHAYQFAKMTPMLQFHVTRRLAPCVASIGISFLAIRDALTAHGTDVKPDIMAALGPAAQVLAAMNEEDANYVMAACFDHIKRGSADGKSWAAINLPGSVSLMFDDIEMMQMIRLCVEVLRLNLGNFFEELIAETASMSS